MMTSSEPILLMVGPQARDTLAMVVPQGLLSTAEAVSTILLTLAVLAVLAALVAVLLQLRALTHSMAGLAQRMEKDAAPVLERARSVAENVDFITLAVRNDVQTLNESVVRLNGRLKNASLRMEERIQDFTALVEVLQSEAEDLALDTAAAVRGVRAGTRTLAGRHRGRIEDPEERDVLPIPSACDGAEE